MASQRAWSRRGGNWFPAPRRSRAGVGGIGEPDAGIAVGEMCCPATTSTLPVMKLRHLSRYSEILGLLWKHGRSDWVRRLDDTFEPKPSTAEAAEGDSAPEQFATDLEEMGPTFIKLGQVLAGRPDLLPAAYVQALARLQDRVKPFPYDQVQQ